MIVILESANSLRFADMKRFTSFFLTLCLSFLIYNDSISQNTITTYDSININNINARINANGTLFYNPLTGASKCEWPAGSGKHLSSAAHVWIGALDPAGQLRLAAQSYGQSGADVWAGPSLPTAQSPVYQYDSLYDQRYNRVWKVTKVQVDAHLAQHGQPGYQMPAAIAEWPGNGLTFNGEPSVIAPYADANGNFFYDPANGDYPLIPGDEAVFCIFNDARNLHTEMNGLPLGVDVRLMFYAFNSSQDTILNNTLFASYAISNPATGMALSDFAIGLWNDVDLGNFGDDLFGTDSSFSAIYAYNGDANDDGPIGYGFNPPAWGVTLLSQSMSGAIGFWNNFSLIGNPGNSIDCYNYMHNRWRDGSHLVANGSEGFAGTAPGPDANWHFSGDPVADSGWNCQSSGIIPSDVRLLGQIRKDSLLPGETFCFDMAWVAARGAQNDQFGSITALKDAIQAVRTSYAAAPVSCAATNSFTAVAPSAENTVRVYPNPASGGYIGLDGLIRGSIVQLFDLQGKMLLQTVCETETADLIVNDFTEGLYIIKIMSNNNIQNFKINIVK